MLPFFSVIVPVYNCGHLISETLDSALEQIFDDFEIIVINDGSTDNTKDVIDVYAAKHPSRMEVIHQENRGEGGGRNRGIFSARGRYLAFLDSDDLWFPWTLRTYYDAILKYEYPAILIATGNEFYTRVTVSAISEGELQASVYDDFLTTAAVRYLPVGTGATVVNAEEARRVGGLSEERVIGIDQEFFLKLGEVKGLVQVTSPVTFATRRHAGNIQLNIPMVAAGPLLFIAKEFGGGYPGGEARKWTRRSIISRLARTVSVQCLRARFFGQAWLIYCRTIPWHLKLRRIKYLVGFPFLYVYESVKPHGKR